MDSQQTVSNQEAANLAQIENARNSREMRNLTRASVVFGAISAVCAIIAVWPILFPPNAAQPSPTGGGSMINWRILLPAIILGLGSLSTATALIIVAFKRWRYKKLAKLTTEIQDDLTKARSDFELERGEHRAKIASLNETLEAAKTSANQLQANNYVLEDDIETSKALTDRLGARNADLLKELQTSQDEVQRLNIALSLANIRESDLKASLQAAKLKANSEASHQANATNRVNELEREKTKWEPILKQASDQAAQIDQWVTMKESIPGKLSLHRERMVTLEIRIFNNSLFPISIRAKDIKGQLHFKSRPLSAEIQIDPNAPVISDLEPQHPALIKLQQPLMAFEAERIQEAREGADQDAVIWLGDLYIPISSKDTTVKVTALPLKINPECVALDVHEFRIR